VGGGSNAAGVFFHFIGNDRVKLNSIEAGGIEGNALKNRSFNPKR